MGSEVKSAASRLVHVAKTSSLGKISHPLPPVWGILPNVISLCVCHVTPRPWANEEDFALSPPLSAPRAADLLLVDFEGVAVLHVELRSRGRQSEYGKGKIEAHYMWLRERQILEQKSSSSKGDGGADGSPTLTDSGLSVGCTRVPSKRKRTDEKFLPWRSQKASMSFLSWVVRLILKKTSLLLSVTLMLRCSGCIEPSSPPLPWWGELVSDMLGGLGYTKNFPKVAGRFRGSAGGFFLSDAN